VISGTLDVSATALGSNALTSNRLALSLGTTMQTNLTMRQFKFPSDNLLVWIFGHVLPEAYVGVLWRETAGLTLRWFRDVFCSDEIQLARSSGANAYDLMTEAAAKIPPGSDGLMILPHLHGTQLPESSPDFRGIFYGISSTHEKAHFIRATLEGVGYTLRENIEIFAELGWQCDEIWPTGGGAKSCLWNQINADITGYPQHLVRCHEAASLGAAILASLGVGLYKDAYEACNQMVHPAGIVQPNLKNRKVYDDGYHLYKKLYQSTKDLFAGVHS